MNSKIKLQLLLDEISLETTKGYAFLEAAHLLKDAKLRFEAIFQEWLNDCKEGREVPFQMIKSTLKDKINAMENEFTTRPSPKLPNLYDLVLSFQNRLKYLKFELDKRDSTSAHQDCYCALRLSNGIGPNFDYLKDYGRAVLYYEDDNCIIKKCKLCGTRWIDGSVPGMLSSFNTWIKWNPKEYLLREVFEEN